MKKVYTGKGMQAMFKTCKKHGLTSCNSTLTVKDPADLNSAWTITVKE